MTAVDKDKAAITTGLQPKTNETKTMGTRHTGPARAAGEGMHTLSRLAQIPALNPIPLQRTVWQRDSNPLDGNAESILHALRPIKWQSMLRHGVALAS